MLINRLMHCGSAHNANRRSEWPLRESHIHSQALLLAMSVLVIYRFLWFSQYLIYHVVSTSTSPHQLSRNAVKVKLLRNKVPTLCWRHTHCPIQCCKSNNVHHQAKKKGASPSHKCASSSQKCASPSQKCPPSALICPPPALKCTPKRPQKPFLPNNSPT